jgi:hypothetical protein
MRVTWSIAFRVPTTVGNEVVVIFKTKKKNAIFVTDSCGNTFTSEGRTSRGWEWHARNIVGGADTVTITYFR